MNSTGTAGIAASYCILSSIQGSYWLVMAISSMKEWFLLIVMIVMIVMQVLCHENVSYIYREH